MFEAVNAIAREFQPYAVRLDPIDGASAEAAAIAAAHAALIQLYPEQRALLDAGRDASLAAIADGAAKRDGIALGHAAAEAMLKLREHDGAAAAIAAIYQPLAGPGYWTPTPTAFRPALDPGWGTVRPFIMATGSQFRPGPPPELTSRQYARDFQEIKDVGSIASATRSQEQTDLARLWIATGPQNWNPIARQAASARVMTLAETARLFALLNMAGADAFIASWDAKYEHSQWRPLTGVRAADLDGNRDTEPDPSWTPLLATPPFPDYIAGHTTYAGAAQRVLERTFGKRPGHDLSLTSATAPGVTRTYTTFRKIALDVVEARILGGIHWRTSSVEGLHVGQAIGRLAVERFLQPSRHPITRGRAMR
jgi:hypothetical protein